MKKIIYTFGALLAVGIASAQSYPKQPDPSVVKYVPYQKPERVESDTVSNSQDVLIGNAESNKKDRTTIKTTEAAALNNNAEKKNIERPKRDN